VTFVTLHNLPSFGISPQRGFLPEQDPLDRMPTQFGQWDEIGRELPTLLAAGRARQMLSDLPVLDPSSLHDGSEIERAMLLLSYFGHAYVWGEKTAADCLPASIAIPWHRVALRLGRPPVLSYASYALHNWQRVDPRGPVELGNIALLQNFLGGQDEEWFILVHVDIEAKAAEIIREIGTAQAAVVNRQIDELTSRLITIGATLDRMYQTLSRMPERCDPYIYYNRVRPYLYGWKDQPALPDGLLYDGVAEYERKRQKFRGETGAQSSIIPSLDALLGVTHKDDPLRAYLREMRDYMPPGHRAFIAAVEQGPSVRQLLIDRATGNGDAKLRDAYNACVKRIEQFRSKHLEYAASYIQKQSQRDRKNPTDIGTGGTPFMRYLKKHRDETAGHEIR
jgi:indoleamine 2,3-dioxygenase